MSVDELLAMARAAGLCYPDCHFLDLDPYEDLFQTLADCSSEEEREAHLARCRRSGRGRRATPRPRQQGWLRHKTERHSRLV